MPKKIEPTGFAARLKELREAAGLTQDALAERTGLYKFSIAKLEQGVREPTWGTVQTLARALGVKCSDFEVVTVGNPSPAASESKAEGRPPKAKPAEAPAPTPAKKGRKKSK